MAQDFRGRNLAGANFQGQNLAEADFRGANLAGADFSRANLKGANFSSPPSPQGQRTCLDRANFSHCQLQGANFSHSSLRSANFSHSQVGQPLPSFPQLLLSAGLALILTSLALLFSQSALVTFLSSAAPLDRSPLLTLAVVLLGLLQLAGLGLLLEWGWSRATGQILLLSGVGSGAVSLLLGWVWPTVAADPSLLILGAISALVLVFFLARSPQFNPWSALPLASLLTLVWDLPLLPLQLAATVPQPGATDLLSLMVPIDRWIEVGLGIAVNLILGTAIGALTLASHPTIVLVALILGSGLAGLLRSLLVTPNGSTLPLLPLLPFPLLLINSLLLIWVSLSIARNLSRSGLAPVRQSGLLLRSWGGTSFRGADLSYGNFLRAVVDGTQFQGAKLYRVYWRGTEGLGRALGGPGAQADRRILELVVGGNGSQRDLQGIDLRGMNLAGVNLETANLAGADLRGATLEGALLRQADLSRVRAEGADFTGSALTGACLTYLKVDQRTILHPVNCDYVFLQDQLDGPDTWTRRPHNPTATFQGRELAQLIRPESR